MRLGEWDVHSDSELFTNIEMDVLSIKYHPEFHAGNLYNDIAIVKLDGVVDFEKNPHISPVCLPDSFQVGFAAKDLLDLKMILLRTLLGRDVG